MLEKPKVLVLAHADTWGALSANQLLPELAGKADVTFVVSRATKDETGSIRTIDPVLRVPRALKETFFCNYLDAIDGVFESSGKKSLLTFKGLAERYAADGKVHFTTCGGPKGGAEVLAILQQVGMPDLSLSVDTMAILPPEIVDNIRCFSTHPGPLDNFKIEGMQGTLRSLINGVYFDSEGRPLPDGSKRHSNSAHVAGTLFLQSPVLDQGTNIERTYTPARHDACAYSLRADVYRDLVNVMIDKLPQLLDPMAREDIIMDAMRAATSNDNAKEIPTLGKGPLIETWAASTAEENIEPLMSLEYFKAQIQQFWPHHEGFEGWFNMHFPDDAVAALRDLNESLKLGESISTDKGMQNAMLANG